MNDIILMDRIPGTLIKYDKRKKNFLLFFRMAHSQTPLSNHHLLSL